MFSNLHPVLIMLIALTSITSYFGFSNRDFFAKNSFDINAIKVLKQRYRFLTSGFLHVDLMHLIFNMLSLYFFSNQILLGLLGIPIYLFIYFGAMLSGNFLTYFFHKNDSYYVAVGASGAVSGIIYTSIALFPTQSEIGLIFLPGISIPAWIFGILYMVYSVYGMKNQIGNIGHSAHIGGAVFGLIVPIFLFPELMIQNGFYIGAISIPIIYLLYIRFFNNNY